MRMGGGGRGLQLVSLAQGRKVNTVNLVYSERTSFEMNYKA